MKRCDRKGCIGPGRWQPVIELRSKKDPIRTAPAHLNIAVCDDHQATMVLDDVMNDEGFTVFTDSFRVRGFAGPDRELTTLGWAEWPTEAVH